MEAKRESKKPSSERRKKTHTTQQQSVQSSGARHIQRHTRSIVIRRFSHWRPATYPNRYAIFIFFTRKFHNKFWSSLFLTVIQWTKSTHHSDAVLSCYFTFSRHVFHLWFGVRSLLECLFNWNRSFGVLRLWLDTSNSVISFSPFFLLSFYCTFHRIIEPTIYQHTTAPLLFAANTARLTRSDFSCQTNASIPK